MSQRTSKEMFPSSSRKITSLSGDSLHIWAIDGLDVGEVGVELQIKVDGTPACMKGLELDKGPSEDRELQEHSGDMV